jgi:pimeloyl-ACP methyl ester carboxylesterase
LQKLSKYHGHKAKWVLDAWTESWMHPSFADWSLQKVHPEINCPTLVLHGANDEFGSRKHPEIISSLVSGTSTMNLMQNCGRVPHRERLKDVLDMMQQFLHMLV